MTIGDEIATTLTTLTFRKAAFNGTQFDFLSDHLAATVLLSRVSAPLVRTVALPAALTNSTDLTAGRLTANAGPVTVGATFVNGHQSCASLERLDGNPFNDYLTTAQASHTVLFGQGAELSASVGNTSSSGAGSTSTPTNRSRKISTAASCTS